MLEVTIYTTLKTTLQMIKKIFLFVQLKPPMQLKRLMSLVAEISSFKYQTFRLPF